MNERGRGGEGGSGRESSVAVAAAAGGAAAAKNGVEAASVYNMATSLLSFLFHRHLTSL